MAIKTFTTGEVLTAADTNTFLANSMAVLVKSQTIGTTVSSVTVTGAFDSTYDNYLIKITGMTGSAAVDTTFQLGGITTGVYITSGFYQSLASATINSYTVTGTTMPAGTMATTQNTQINIEISGPNLAVTKYVQMTSASATLRANSATQIGSVVQATAFTIAPTSGTLTGGNITVYGYRKG
jgi:hypothetical protein